MKISKTICKIAWLVFRFLLLLWIALFLLQRYILYHPSKDTLENIVAEAQTLNFEPWQLPNGETIGYKSHALRNDPRRNVTILVTHGNAGSALDRVDYLLLLREALPDLAISLYILEYPGYGARKGKPSQESFLDAAQHALSYIPEQPLIILGESIGTGVACALAAEFPQQIAGLLLVTPFDSLINVAQHKFPFIPARPLVLDPFPSDQWLQSYNGPVAVIVAGQDSVIPPSHARKLYNEYRGPKKLIEVPEADHNEVVGQLPLEEWAKALNFVLEHTPDNRL
jgi:pimeloyl-ACP methyl ester carboxylesterase